MLTCIFKYMPPAPYFHATYMKVTYPWVERKMSSKVRWDWSVFRLQFEPVVLVSCDTF